MSPNSNLSMKLCKLNTTECDVSENLNEFVVSINLLITQYVNIIHKHIIYFTDS